MKKLFTLVLALALIASMIGVVSAEEVQTINACIGSQPETLDPQLNSASDGSNYIKHLFEGLMKYDWEGNGIVLGAADSYEVSDDGLVYTFHIRPEAKWSDGQDLTAEDFEYTMKRLVDPATAAPYAGDMGKYILNGLDITTGAKAVAYCMALWLPMVAPMGGSQSITSVDPDASVMPSITMPPTVTFVMAALPVFSTHSFSGAPWPVRIWKLRILSPPLVISYTAEVSCTLYAKG